MKRFDFLLDVVTSAAFSFLTLPPADVGVCMATIAFSSVIVALLFLLPGVVEMLVDFLLLATEPIPLPLGTDFTFS